ncbi:MAG: peptide deformylase [Bdellovibrionaceae bacterium]|nr:peptide deformylase [Pseudobdellovibrionaceae bacterium]MDW8190642.1 peptide deformylase [Pseudobdellovibrionaceae bacterium]
MLLQILTYPDPRLREIALPVKQFGDPLKKLAEDMLETMYHAKGIGLAAPQVGRLERFLVIDCRPKNEHGRYEIKEMTELEQKITQPLFMANPSIVERRGKTTFEEGCLSVPTYYETVERAQWVRVRYQDLEGQEQMLETDGLLAIVIQHEMDHLEGTLFIDRISFAASQKIKSQIQKYGYSRPTSQKETEKEPNKI